MKTKELEKVIHELFPSDVLDFFKDSEQYGFNNYTNKEINRVGYCVNLTLDTIIQAKKQGVDLILTHHNAWEDHFEWREDCFKELKDVNLIHYFNHLPLDSVEFGPTGALASILGVRTIDRFCKFEDYAFGIIGEFDEEISMADLQKKVETVLTHDVRVWINNNRPIKRLAIVAGSGGDLETLHEAVEFKCDTYITGEKKLKTLLYAKHNKMSFILGSHTFTERRGMQAFIERISKVAKDVEFIELYEEFIE